MREEIIRALDQVRNSREQWQLWQQQHHEQRKTRVAQSDEFPPENHPLSQERNKKLDQVIANLDRLKACIERSLGISSVYIGTSTSLEVYVDSSTKNQVVIEFTVEGPLAATFVYGSVSRDTLQSIYQCIHACGLIQLSDDEIRELEQNGNYHQLF